MSRFGKFLATIGIGGTEVDTVLEKDEYAIGEVMQGAVRISGGKVEQKIDSIKIVLVTAYFHDDRKYTCELQKIQVSDTIIVQANEKKEIPFQLTIPLVTPITFGRRTVWVQTKVDVKDAVDPTDTDFIAVKPNKLIASTVSALESMGFRIKEINNKAAKHYSRTRLPFIQEIEFNAYSTHFSDKIKEVEIYFSPMSENEIEVYLEVDRRVGGVGAMLADAMDIDSEAVLRLRFTTEDIPYMVQRFEELFRRI